MHKIELRGATTNNLKSVSFDLDPGSFVVVCGRSGSGKSSLAISTLYAEGQRRYVESFSAYARQFLERLARPPVERLDPIAASIAVDRQGATRTSRSSVGTMTEVADYAKSLWATRAVLHCAQCKALVKRDHPAELAAQLIDAHPAARLVVTFSCEVDSLSNYLTVRDSLASDGFTRFFVGGQALASDQIQPSQILGDVAAVQLPKASKKKKVLEKQAPILRTFSVVIDRVVATAENRARLTEALETAFLRGNERASVVAQSAEQTLEKTFSRSLHCANCDIAYVEATEGHFSFNSPLGACETCRGFGRVIGVDWEKVFPDHRKTLTQNAIAPWASESRQWERTYLKKHAALAKVPMNVPLASLTPEQQEWLKNGDGRGWNKGFAGLREWFTWLESKAYKMHVRVLLSRYRSYDTCPTCEGTRFRKSSLLYTIHGKSIADFLALRAQEASQFVATVPRREDSNVVLEELKNRLCTLERVGLSYLALDRAARTLSGGEAQRVALTTALSASLSGSLIVLDEPTVGLHPKDVPALIEIVRELTARGNIVVAVEHDHDFIRAADRVLELGPESGAHGGTLVFDGAPQELTRSSTSTGQALANVAPRMPTRRKACSWYCVEGASGNNLQDVTLRIPVGVLTCVTGVSGSGKSSAVGETLVPIVQRAGGNVAAAPLAYRKADDNPFASVVYVDQAPLGRTSRGNAATYIGLWDTLRTRLAATELAKSRAYTHARFSFNVAGGRCETCAGDGAETVEMQFMADITFSCPDCGGKRFVGEVLDIEYLGKNAAEWLESTYDDVRNLIANEPRKQSRESVLTRAQPVCDVGLGYLRLGQSLNTLSDGEAQRLRLAEALMHSQPGSLIVLDEPSSGLHSADVAPLLRMMHRLVDRGDTVVVVEHDMEIVREADFVIDLGPHAGPNGGFIVAEGTPEQVAALAQQEDTRSETAKFLAQSMGIANLATTVSTLSQPVRSMPKAIQVVGACENNLKNIHQDVPLGKLVAITGPSGSGKSTFAFDVIFAEGQRRYMETLSPYARQYLPQLPRPHVGQVNGIPPTVALEQRITRGGANSTVSTVTEVAHYLRVAFARAGQPHCVECKTPITARAPNLIAEDIAARFGARAEVRVLGPVIRSRKGTHRDVLEKLFARGVREVWIDGVARVLEPGLQLARFVEHDIDAVLGSFRAGDAVLESAVREASKECEGNVRIEHKGERTLYSTRRACAKCGAGYPDLDPRFFSFNTQQGRCSTCEGKGLVTRSTGRGKALREETVRCDDCQGTRLSPLARSVKLDEETIDSLHRLTVDGADERLSRIQLGARESRIAEVPIAEARKRLAFLRQVGLHYLALDRSADTLSGGETQRVRLASQLGSGLTGLLYVLDEPTIGLHPRDTHKLLHALRELVDRGNSVMVVEHDTEIIRQADHVIDIGPEGGKLGGHVVASGTPEQVQQNALSLTGKSLQQRPQIKREQPQKKGAPKEPMLRVVQGTMYNLRGVTAALPIGKLSAITGVSGSGKSTLVRRILLPAVVDALAGNKSKSNAYKSIEGVEFLKRATVVDQSPIGRTPRSVPATYVGMWDELRKILASTAEARARGFEASRFSFNVAHDGRCGTCQGNGALTIEMSFLPDVFVGCETCKGMRFTRETLLPRIHGYSAGDLLRMEVKQAKEVLASIPKVHRALALLDELGLGYLELGQPSHTLSGGEAQRVKLVAELAKVDPLRIDSTKTLYVLDEPTTGLHRSDVQKLIAVLEKFTARGDTVVVVEHNLDLIARADWIVDLGPDGGKDGGQVLYQGSPQGLLTVATSATGQALSREQ